MKHRFRFQADGVPGATLTLKRPGKSTSSEVFDAFVAAVGEWLEESDLSDPLFNIGDFLQHEIADSKEFQRICADNGITVEDVTNLDFHEKKDYYTPLQTKVSKDNESEAAYIIWLPGEVVERFNDVDDADTALMEQESRGSRGLIMRTADELFDYVCQSADVRLIRSVIVHVSDETRRQIALVIDKVDSGMFFKVDDRLYWLGIAYAGHTFMRLLSDDAAVTREESLTHIIRNLRQLHE